jgi:hypothetical protein
MAEQRFQVSGFEFRVADLKLETGNSKHETYSQEEHMCPACIESTAVIVAGIGSTGGLLAVCIGKFRKFFRASVLGLIQKSKEN